MGFVSKHKERDYELPNNRKKLLDEIQNDLLDDDNVLAIFYGGSIGSENTDAFSDIDLRVVVKPDRINEYISSKIIVQRTGETFFILKTWILRPFLLLPTTIVS